MSSERRDIMSDAGENASGVLVERLVGERGEPDRVTAAARACAERALPAITAGINGQLSAPLGIEIASVDILRFAEARPAAGSRDAMVVAASASSPDALVMTLDAQAIAIIINCFFGGDPEMPTSPIDRDLSPIEREVATTLFSQFAEAFNGSGPRAFNFKFPLPAPLYGEEMEKHALRDGPAARIVFHLGDKNAPGVFAVTMPQRVLLKHRGDAVAADAGNPQAESGWKARFGEEIMRSSVALEATIPLNSMTLGEVAMLAPGMVIEMPENAQAATRLSARDQTVFVCEFGKLGHNYTVRVRHPYDAGQEFMDGLLAR